MGKQNITTGSDAGSCGSSFHNNAAILYQQTYELSQ